MKIETSWEKFETVGKALEALEKVIGQSDAWDARRLELRMAILKAVDEPDRDLAARILKRLYRERDEIFDKANPGFPLKIQGLELAQIIIREEAGLLPNEEMRKRHGLEIPLAATRLPADSPDPIRAFAEKVIAEIEGYQIQVTPPKGEMLTPYGMGSQAAFKIAVGIVEECLKEIPR